MIHHGVFTAGTCRQAAPLASASAITEAIRPGGARAGGRLLSVPADRMPGAGTGWSGVIGDDGGSGDPSVSHQAPYPASPGGEPPGLCLRLPIPRQPKRVADAASLLISRMSATLSSCLGKDTGAAGKAAWRRRTAAATTGVGGSQCVTGGDPDLRRRCASLLIKVKQSKRIKSIFVCILFEAPFRRWKCRPAWRAREPGREGMPFAHPGCRRQEARPRLDLEATQ